MTPVIVSPAADQDTAEILEFIGSKSGPIAAAAFDERLAGFYKQLSQFPECGSPRPMLGRNIRIGVLRPYVVLYRSNGTSNRIDILRVLHGLRDVAAEMKRS